MRILGAVLGYLGFVGGTLREGVGVVSFWE